MIQLFTYAVKECYFQGSYRILASKVMEAVAVVLFQHMGLPNCDGVGVIMKFMYA